MRSDGPGIDTFGGSPSADTLVFDAREQRAGGADPTLHFKSRTDVILTTLLVELNEAGQRGFSGLPSMVSIPSDLVPVDLDRDATGGLGSGPINLLEEVMAG
jgi:hypothetical protein